MVQNAFKYVAAGMSAEKDKTPRKRLFIGLVTGTALLLCLALLAGWIIPVVGLGNIHPLVPYITACILVASICIIVWAALGLVLQIVTGRLCWGASRVRGITIKFFLPVMEFLAKAVGCSVNEVRRSFIQVNNELTKRKGDIFLPESLLILLPHCLQNSECPLRLSYTIDLCKRCGRCPISGMLALKDAYGFRIAVATGGTIARRIVVQARPELIIAVACERDLTSGIQDTHPLPVYGILNERPEGPCTNTLVPLELVEQTLRIFVRPEFLPPQVFPNMTSKGAQDESVHT